ncbi:MAG: PqqD family protein, partial [Planctomycetota bacterium]
RCDGRTTTRRIACILTTEYDVTFDQALDDVEQLVVFFAQAGLTGASNTP